MLTRRQIIKGTVPMALCTAGVCVNIHASAEPQQESLEELLAWAKDHDCYVEVYIDGSARSELLVRADEGYWFVKDTWDADTLREALEMAKAEIEKQAL